MSVLDFPTAEKPAVIPPLYPEICGAIQSDGTLPEDFALPRPAPSDPENKIRFADGAFDGISLYHMQQEQRDIKSLTEILGLMSVGSFDKALECLALFFSVDDFISMLSMIDDLQNWIVAHQAQLNAGNLYLGSLYLLKNSADIESIKFALACLELMDTGHDPQARNLIQVMALSDEFTLFCLFIMRTWPDSSEAILAAGKKVSGWGRIHAAALLEAETEEQRRWLLTEGWRNTIMCEYSALTCAEKSGLLEKVKDGTLDGEEFSAACALLPHLLSEGPVAGISAVEDSEDFLSAFLSLLEQHCADEPALPAVHALLDYEQDRGTPHLDRITRCRELLSAKKP